MDSFEEICQMYYKRVYRFLLALSGNPQQAEDLTQEVFYKALLHISDYEDKGYMFTWLCTIGKNIWLNECRKRKRIRLFENTFGILEKKQADGSAGNPAGSMSGSPEEKVVAQENRRAVQEAILSLPKDYQDVVILHIYGEVPLREIAVRKGKSESWGKVTFYRAKRMLKERLEGY